MKKTLPIIFLAFILVSVHPLSFLHAQQRAVRLSGNTALKRLALVIGNSSYETAPLRNPANDAQDMAQALKNVGFEVTAKTNLNQVEMKRAIRDFVEKLRGGGVGLFYFAGHGVQIKGENYLIPINATIDSENEVEYEGVNAGWILTLMRSVHEDANIIILDACRDNPFTKNRSYERGLASMTAPKGSFIAYATAPGDVTRDGIGRNGVYTQEILKHIYTPNLSIEKMFKEVRKGVEKQVPSQTPWESTSLFDEFYFVEDLAVNTSSPTAQPSSPKTQTGSPGVAAPRNQMSRPKAPSLLFGGAVTSNKINFTLNSCGRSNGLIQCNLTITNLGEPRQIGVFAGSKWDTALVDNRGIKLVSQGFRADTGTLGEGDASTYLDLDTSASGTVSIKFPLKYLLPDTAYIKTLKIDWALGKFGGNELSSKSPIKFENVPILGSLSEALQNTARPTAGIDPAIKSLPNVKSVVSENITFHLVECKFDRSFVSCDLLLTNDGRGRALTIEANTKGGITALKIPDGQTYYANSIKRTVGEPLPSVSFPLPANQSERISVRFDTVPSHKRYMAELKLAWGIGEINSNTYYMKDAIHFKNIRVE